MAHTRDQTSGWTRAWSTSWRGTWYAVVAALAGEVIAITAGTAAARRHHLAPGERRHTRGRARS
ncbi:hypothetical protein ABZ916_23800 [Streptomyces sp. NPDC046853]|uniref:hypothetical protein n=1 Tax=Streptomyces sp. NPDC046853 TaxID=3154920 RepID=UPI0033E617BE